MPLVPHKGIAPSPSYPCTNSTVTFFSLTTHGLPPILGVLPPISKLTENTVELAIKNRFEQFDELPEDLDEVHKKNKWISYEVLQISEQQKTIKGKIRNDK